MKRIYLIHILWLSLLLLPHLLAGQTSTQNYIRTRTSTNSTGSTYLEKVEYYDGLGRLSEVVQAKMGGSSQDLVSLIDYDAYGRQDKVWLPAVRSGNNSAYVTPSTLRSGASSSNLNDAKPYSQTVYEASPLNRPLKSFGPGNDWHANDRAVHTGYKVNTASGELSCRLYTFTGNLVTVSASTSGMYGTNQLFVTETKDEDNNISYTFTDKQGQVVLTRQKSGSTLFDTYYIYDKWGNLRIVLPPLAADAFTSSSQTATTANLTNYAYLYQYDSRNRCIAKKLPGADWIYYVYDKADRLIFTQDGEQRTRSEWTFTIPDAFGRTVLSGICKNSLNYSGNPLSSTVVMATRSDGTNSYKGYTVNSTLTTATVHSVWYYDNYTFCGYNGIPSGSNTTEFKEESKTGYDAADRTKGKGQLTGELQTMLKGTATTLSTVYYYDARGRLVQTKHKDHNGKINKEFLSLAYDGLPEKRYLHHVSPANTTYSEEYLYAYDHARRPTTTTHKWDGATTGKVLDANTYDEFGRLKKHKPLNMSILESTVNYDVRSRMTQSYRRDFNDILTYSYGGNITSHRNDMAWDNKKYEFSYDGLSRLTNAQQVMGNGQFSTIYTYDKHGNMQSITRKGRTASGGNFYGDIDNITIVRDGNRIKSANDAVGTILYVYSQDFKNYTNQTTEYTYNRNGSMTKDLNRGITSVSYNLLNLPDQIDIKSPVAEARNEYYYSSDGVKRKVIKKWNPNYSTSPVIGSAVNTSSLTSTETTDYSGNMVYVDNSLKRVLTENGYIENNTYYCIVKDYLGNTRVVADPEATGTGEFRQYASYYPFGMAFGDGANPYIQPYKYGGKEFDNKHGVYLYDFEARFYDPALGRFMTMDPLAEKYYSISPYAYCGNNPMRYTDPTGREWDDPLEAEQLKGKIENKINTLHKDIAKSQSNIDKGGLNSKQITKLENKISEANSRIANLSRSIVDIDKLGADKNNIYALTPTSGGIHQVRRGSDGKISIETSSDAMSIHEIAHVRQSLDAGGLRFSMKGELLNVGSLAPASKRAATISNMEIEAYKMQYSYDRSFPGNTTGLQGINVHSVGGLMNNGIPIYPIINQYSNFLKQQQKIINSER